MLTLVTYVSGYQMAPHPSVCAGQDWRGAVSMVTASPQVASAPGNPSASDESDFLSDPPKFCAERARQHGAVFTTGAFGGAAFVGDAAGLQTVTSTTDGAALGAPFAKLSADAAGSDLFAEYAEAFSSECYECIFDWIPKYKEAGFSTFRFEDFIDGRVRKVTTAKRGRLAVEPPMLPPPPSRPDPPPTPTPRVIQRQRALPCSLR